jgi:fatty acid desaturase
MSKTTKYENLRAKNYAELKQIRRVAYRTIFYYVVGLAACIGVLVAGAPAWLPVLAAIGAIYIIYRQVNTILMVNAILDLARHDPSVLDVE